MNTTVTTYKEKSYSGADIKISGANSTITDGNLNYYQYGHVVIVRIVVIQIQLPVANTEVRVSKTGIFPIPKHFVTVLLSEAHESGFKFFLHIGYDGAVYSYYTKQGESGTDRSYSGVFTYFTDII